MLLDEDIGRRNRVQPCGTRNRQTQVLLAHNDGVFGVVHQGCCKEQCRIVGNRACATPSDVVGYTHKQCIHAIRDQTPDKMNTFYCLRERQWHTANTIRHGDGCWYMNTLLQILLVVVERHFCWQNSQERERENGFMGKQEKGNTQDRSGVETLLRECRDTFIRVSRYFYLGVETTFSKRPRLETPPGDPIWSCYTRRVKITFLMQ